MTRKIKRFFKYEKAVTKTLFVIAIMVVVGFAGLVASGVEIPRKQTGGYYLPGLGGYGPDGYFDADVIGGYYSRPCLMDIFDSGYPNGTLIKTAAANVYLIEEGYRRWVVSPTAFESWGLSWTAIETVSAAEAAKYPTGSNLLARPGTLIKGPGPKIYLVNYNSQKQWIETAATFNALGYRWGSVKTVSAYELGLYNDGAAIADPAARYDGALVKGSGAEVYMVTDTGNGQIDHIYSAVAFTSWGYSWGDIVTITDTELNLLLANYINGTVLAAPGTLLKVSGGPEIYVTDNLASSPFTRTYYKRHIPNMTTFTNRGYSITSVNTVTTTELNQYTTGQQVRPE